MNCIVVGEPWRVFCVQEVLTDGENNVLVLEKCPSIVANDVDIIIIVMDELGAEKENVIKLLENARGILFAIVVSKKEMLSPIEKTIAECIPSLSLPNKDVWMCGKPRDLFDYLGVMYDEEQYPRSEEEDE